VDRYIIRSVFGQRRHMCREYGLHIARTNRLWIVSARHSDFARYRELASDPEAQHWLGWPEEDRRQGDSGMVAAPWDPANNREDVMTPGKPELFFAAVDRPTRRVVAGIGMAEHYVRGLRWFDIGGVVHADFRGRGCGSEAMRAVIRLAHKHFGVYRIYAGCERANVASARWLAGAGFAPTPGVPKWVLPNGREIDSLWWARELPLTRSRCPWFGGSGTAPLSGVGDGVRDDVGDVVVHQRVGDLPPAPLGTHDRGPAQHT
jgi:RimJ/RimL family protein N-acetyltransferase